MVGEKLSELVCVLQQRARDPVCKAIFDPLMELLWTASASGTVHSHICPTMEKYSVFGAHNGMVVGLLLTTEGVISVSADALRMHTRGGLPVFSFRDKGVADMLCCEWERPAAARVLLGHAANRISVFDMATSSISSSVHTSQGISVMRSNGRLVACGGTAGELSLKDLRTMKTEHSVDAHPGKITSLELKGDLLVSCGLTQHMGRLYSDPVIKVFDIRQAVRPLTHIPFVPGPTTLHFQPKFSSIVVATAGTGAILVTDVQGGGTDCQTYQVDCGEDFLVTSDVSNSGELLAFGDSGGFVHLWGTFDRARVNLFSQPTELPDVSTGPHVHISERDSFSYFYQPFSSTLFSTVDSALPIHVGLPPRTVDPSLLEQTQSVDFVKVVQNPHWQLGSPYGDATRASVGLRNTRQKGKTDIESLQITDRRSLGVSGAKGIMKFRWLPKGYRRVEAKQSQSKLRYEEFDFSYYNKTRFAGLENDTINSYCNALLQVLYFIPQLQSSVTRHICEREFCLTCELGFVLHMLDLARGDTCQPTNLLRALRQIPEASALGLVEGPDEWESSKEKSLAKKIQTFSRFLLEQLHKEAQSGSTSSETASQGTPLSDYLFGMTYRLRTKCFRASHEDIVQERRLFQVDLQYATGKAGVQPTFAELLERSLCKQEEVRVWCSECRSYVQVQQIRAPCNLPRVLIVSCCVKGDAELSFWLRESHQARPDNKSSNTESGRSFMSKAAYQSGADMWLPSRLGITLDPQYSRVRVIEDRSPRGSNEQLKTKTSSANVTGAMHGTYELTAMIAHIHDEYDNGGRPQEESEGHLIAHVKIPPRYFEKHAPHSSSPTAGAPAGAPNQATLSRGVPYSFEWVLFNDFCISPSSAAEVVTMYGKQKVPCLLYYTCIEDSDWEGTEGVDEHTLKASDGDKLLSSLFSRKVSSPISQELFNRLISEPSRDAAETATSSFVALDMATESPRPGMLLGIDAEFVALSAAEKGSRGDGSEYIIRPARLGLARVSVVRGGGEKAGVCCIDDYICTVEPVHDYLTRYSGVSPGDLDPTTSKHPVTTLKKAYLKLRYLVDSGCLFVGHGLKKDFRMINIVVPQEQIIDTVELFHLKKSRKLSLRFLASYLLNANIQNETHDSIEDACTALRLYAKYKELVASGQFFAKLTEIYDYGRSHGWEMSRDAESSKDVGEAGDPGDAAAQRGPAG